MFDDRYFNMYAKYYKVKVLLHVYQNLQDMEKSHDAFLQGAQLELKKEMATLQKKILMDTVSRALLAPSLVNGAAMELDTNRWGWQVHPY